MVGAASRVCDRVPAGFDPQVALRQLCQTIGVLPASYWRPSVVDLLAVEQVGALALAAEVSVAFVAFVVSAVAFVVALALGATVNMVRVHAPGGLVVKANTLAAPMLVLK